MARWKLPPKEKIYEAFSVLSDGRYKILSDTKAESISSNHTKSYVIEWENTFPLRMTANDNGTYWKGYIGYPMIALLMLTGKISYDKQIAGIFGNIDWNALNKESKHDYKAVVDSVLLKMKNKEDIQKHVDLIYDQLRNLNLHKLKKRQKPPK